MILRTGTRLAGPVCGAQMIGGTAEDLDGVGAGGDTVLLWGRERVGTAFNPRHRRGPCERSDRVLVPS